MYIEITFFALLSTVLLFSCILLGVYHFGLQWSYSANAPLWASISNGRTPNPWSLLTLLAGFFICPALLEIASGSVLQFLGFLVPVYLMVIALTPNFQTNRTQFIIHVTASILCVLGGLFWLVFIAGAWKLVAGVTVFVLTLALLTGTAKTSLIFWLEMVMFLSVYIAVLVAVL